MQPARAPLTSAALALALACFTAPASALVIPIDGWVPIRGNADLWQDALGSCLIKEEKYGQAFPQLASQDKAQALAAKLRAGLIHAKLQDVTTQAIERGNSWGVLASYAYEEGGITYRVSQLYLSNSGLLRTVSGSSAMNNTSECAAQMREFIRYQAN